VARLGESLALIKPLLAGEAATADGPNYRVAGAQVAPVAVQKPRPPILVAGSGRRLLSLAAREADIVALGVAPADPEAAAAEKVGWIRKAAPERFDDLELNLNVMAVGDRVPRWIATQMGLTAAALAESGSVSALMGTTDQICETLLRRRETLGVSYVVVGDELMESLAPVVERLAGR
jgi:alkanesulfonate monooxygenase SsuD/methylene tetrahydromethanopterin reductase-like flavin-dependent oxidoreductase (luciferase family)